MSICETKTLPIDDDPSDWPADIIELRDLDSLLRCSICFEYFNIAVTATGCYHNYCSLCARKYISCRPQCPTCYVEMRQSQLKSNRVLDEIVRVFIKLRPKLLSILKEHRELKLMRKDIAISNEKVKECSLQQSREDVKFAEASIRSEAAFQLDDEKSETEDLDSFQLKHLDMREEAEESSPGSTTTTMSEIDSRAVDHLGQTKESSIGCSNNGLKQFKSQSDSCTTKNLQKRGLQDPTDSTECGQPVKRRKIGNETSGKTGEKSNGNETKYQGHSAFLRAASNDLLPVNGVECRKKLPDFVFGGLSEKQLKRKLREYGLSSKGDKRTLQSRLKSFSLLYNSQCDAANPMPVSDIIKQIESTETTQKKLNKGHILIQTYDLSKSDQEKQEFNESYLIKHKEQFDSLINDIKVRGKNFRQQITSDTSSATDAMNQKNTKREDTNLQTKTESIFTPDAASETNIIETMDLADGRMTGYEEDASFVSLKGRALSTENISLFSKNNERNVSSEDYLAQRPVEGNFTNAIPGYPATPQKSSRSTEESTFYQSPECKVIELLDKAVSAAIPLVEKLHEAFCKCDISPSKCNFKHSPSKSINETERAGHYQENDVKTSISKEQLSGQNPSLIPIGTSRAAATCTKDESKAYVFQRNEGKTGFNRKPYRDVTKEDSILILDSDEELHQTGELSRGQWVQTTPMRDPIKNGTGKIESPSINSSASSTKSSQQKSSTLSATLIPSSVGRVSNSQSRHRSTYSASIPVSAEDADSSKRVGKNVKRNIMKPRRDRANLKGSEVSSKNSTRKSKQKRHKSQNITSFFYKVGEGKTPKVTNEAEDLQRRLSFSSSALFHTSSSGESDLELSVTKIDQPVEKNVNSHRSRADDVSRATASLAHKTCILSHVDNYDSDEEFFSKACLSAKEVKAIESSPSSDEFVIKRSKRHTKSGRKCVDSDMAVSPKTRYPLSIEASSDTTHSSTLSNPSTSFDSTETYIF